MAIMKKKQLMQMSNKDIDDKLKEIRLELSRERASSEIGILKSPKKIRELRRSAAKIITMKNMKQKGVPKQ